MPTIAVFPDPIRAYNRVEINWADLPGVEYARVLRVDVESGTCTPLRPYVCYFGDYLKLSCGHGIFWDTEVPLDRQVYYLTEGLDAPCVPDPVTPVISDLFTRVNVDTWNTPTVGPAYSVYSGPLTQYDVSGTEGQITPDTLNVNRYVLLDAGISSYEAQIDLSSQTIPTGGSVGAYGLNIRWVDDNNYFRIGINMDTAGLSNLFITRVLAGAATVTAIPTSLVLTNINSLKIRADGPNISAKVWQAGTLEPVNYQMTVSYTDHITSTLIGAHARRDTGNITPTILEFDNFSVTSLCTTCTPVTADTSADPVTMPSNGAFRLRDPVRPCNDMYIPLCFAQTQQDPNCVPGRGTFFANMDVESYATNSLLLNPTNAALALSVNRKRRGVSSVLNLVTRTFLDRDDLLRINEPGTPLLLSGPPQYGIPDRYMAVGELSIERGVSNHKFQVRNALMPFLQVARPAGPSNGVCGSRLQDMCDIYPTLADMEAAGLTWDDLIRGRASNDGGNPVGGYRTWADVLSEFADWADVLANGTWRDLLEGN